MSILRILASLIVTSIGAAIAGPAVGQALPAPPSRLCVDDVCPTDEAQTKWHPGHYMQHRSYDQAVRFRDYDKSDFASNRNIQGVSVFFKWNQLEGDSRGDYAAGVQLIKAEVAKLKSLPVPKRLIIRVMDRRYDPTPSLDEYARIYPRYMRDSGRLFVSKNTLSWKRYDEETNGWFIDMLKAYAREFDNDPYVEMICPFQETSYPGTDVAPSDFSEGKLRSQYDRLAMELRTAWRNTNVWIPTNWGPYSTMESYVKYLRSINVAAGNPDTAPVYQGTEGGMRFDRIFRGELGSTDFRGTMITVYAVEDSNLGYSSVGGASFTAQQIFDFTNGTQKVNYMLWDRNTHIGTDDMRWYKQGTSEPGGILNVINMQKVANTDPPVRF